MAIPCVVCGAVTAESVSSVPYVEAGLAHVVLHDVTIVICSGSGHSRVVIDARGDLHREIAGRLIRKSGPLVAEEVRFLRSHLDFTNEQLARCLGVTPATSSRWASPASGVWIAPTADRMLRLIVAVRDQRHCASLSWLGDIARTAPTPLGLDLWRTVDGWREVQVAASGSWCR